MKARIGWIGSTGALVVALAVSLAGCGVLERVGCAPNCRSQAHNSSSLVSFLYPDGSPPPSGDAIPQLKIPLRVGLAFLPPQSGLASFELDEAHKEQLLERIHTRFADRKFVSEIVIIPDYYLKGSRGYEGLAGVQRLYGVDLMALVSYDQVTYTADTKASLGYLTILGAFVIPGTVDDVTTLVDLAVVDPVTRSLVLRAGGTDTRSEKMAPVDLARGARQLSSAGFDAATNAMIEHFDVALVAFEKDVQAGRARVTVASRSPGSGGGGGAAGAPELVVLSLAVALSRLVRPRPGA